MDGGIYNLLPKNDYEILWRIIETESLKLYVTNIALQSVHVYCQHLGGIEWANRLLAKLKSDTNICQVTSAILTEARLSQYCNDLDFEDVVEILCVKEYELEALVSDSSESFQDAPVKAIAPTKLLDYVPKSFKLWAAYTLEGQRDFTDWDLQDENLVELDLSGSNFTRAKMAGAELIGVNFSNCQLTEADLSQTWLMDADLSNSSLSKANLQGADLSTAQCPGTDFTDANIAGVNFKDANLEGAKAAKLDWSVVDLKEVDTSAIDLHGASLEDFTVRNISNLTELKQAHGVMSYQSNAPALDFTQLKQWWTAYPNGIKALFYQKQIIAGVFTVWALTESSTRSLQQQKINEPDLDICSSQALRKNHGSHYWYIDGVYLNYSLRNTSNLNNKYLSLLLSESLKIWLYDERKYIPKKGKIELFTFFPSKKHNPQSRHGFQKQPGRHLDGRVLYGRSLPYSELESQVQRFLRYKTGEHS
jgi:hypothetical protein